MHARVCGRSRRRVETWRCLVRVGGPLQVVCDEDVDGQRMRDDPLGAAEDGPLGSRGRFSELPSGQARGSGEQCEGEAVACRSLQEHSSHRAFGVAPRLPACASASRSRFLLVSPSGLAVRGLLVVALAWQCFAPDRFATSRLSSFCALPRRAPMTDPVTPEGIPSSIAAVRPRAPMHVARAQPDPRRCARKPM